MARLQLARPFMLGAGATALLLYLRLSTYLPSHDHPPSAVATGGGKDEAAFMRQAASDNEERLLRVKEVCSRYNLGLHKHSSELPTVQHPPTPQYGVFYIDKVHKLSWCPVYKAGSSTWLYNLCLLGGYTEQQLADSHRQLSDLARIVLPELEYADAEQAFHNTLKLMVVRHPFARLLSAYRDKLENSQLGPEHGTLHFYRKYGRAIVQKYRPNATTTRTQHLLTSNQYILDPNLPKPLGNEPTFQEFARYLIDTDLVHYADDHWIPYYLFCTPCLLNYDIIGKVETLFRDQQFVIRSAGLEKLVKPMWKHKTTNYSGSEVAKRYFSQLTQKEVVSLYQKYKLDFELFGYKIDDYLRYSIKKS